jgi:hypothetical protein
VDEILPPIYAFIPSELPVKVHALTRKTNIKMMGKPMVKKTIFPSALTPKRTHMKTIDQDMKRYPTFFPIRRLGHRSGSSSVLMPMISS